MSVTASISAILVLVTGYTVVQASAIAYGHTLQLHRSRLPRMMLVARILKERRGKNSYLFMIKWAWWHTNKHTPASTKAMQLSGIKERDLRQIRGLYQGLRQEIGHFHAVAGCTQIIRNLEARRKR